MDQGIYVSMMISAAGFRHLVRSARPESDWRCWLGASDHSQLSRRTAPTIKSIPSEAATVLQWKSLRGGRLSTLRRGSGGTDETAVLK
jgi:hypothetical protein